MIRFRLTRSALLLACAISAPSLFDAFVGHTIEPTTAVLRFAMAIVFSVVAVGVVTSVVEGYRVVNAVKAQETARQQLRRRRDDDPLLGE
jgi:hypothetical protein